jgi:hypothetical protein
MTNPNSALRLYQAESNKREDLDAAVAEMMASKEPIFSRLW